MTEEYKPVSEEAWAVRAVFLHNGKATLWGLWESEEEAVESASRNNEAQDDYEKQGKKRYIRFFPIKILIKEIIGADDEIQQDNN